MSNREGCTLSDSVPTAGETGRTARHPRPRAAPAVARPRISPAAAPTLARSLRLSTAALLLATVAGCPRPAQLPAAGGVSAERVAAGVPSPVALVSSADGTGRLFIVSQSGRIFILHADGTLAETPFLDLRDRLVGLSPFFDERGLLGLAFHPRFRDDGRFFAIYNAPPAAGSSADSRLVLSAFRVSADDADRADADSEQVLLSIDKPQPNHNGGQLAFGPDGYLYFSVGDGGGGGDDAPGHNPQIGNAQDPATLLGKICRIDVDAGDPYAIPPDNPFVARDGARPEIFALGLRNAWRFSFDPPTGRLFAGDVGQGVREEIDLIAPGGNFGWRIREGSTCFNLTTYTRPLAACAEVDADGAPLIGPILDYGRDVGTSVIGGFFYRGRGVPALAGKYVFGDFNGGAGVGGRLLVATEAADGSWSFEELLLSDRENGRLGRFVFAFGQDDAGELYVLTAASVSATAANGEVFKLVAAP